MSSVVLKVFAKHIHENNLKHKLSDVKAIDAIFESVRSTFAKLVEDRFIEKLPELELDETTTVKTKAKIPKFQCENVRSNIPEIRINGS